MIRRPQVSAAQGTLGPVASGTPPRTAPAPPPPEQVPKVAGERHHGSRWRRHPLRVVAVVAACLVVLYLTISFFVAWQLTKGTHAALDVSPTTIGAVHEDVGFPSRVDRVPLRGWLFHASAPSGRSVIFVHGMQANRLDTNSGLDRKAHDMLQHGYDALLFDLRANGESGGDRWTLGENEPRDVLGAYDFMRSRGYDPGRMAILAVSLGASIAITASPQMPDLGAVVSDTAYAELRPLLEKDLPTKSHLPSFFNWGIITEAQLFFGVNPDLRPIDTVRALPGRAFLFIHAPEDDFTPVSDAERLRAASANPRSRLVLIHSPSGHTKAYLAHPAEYMAAVYAFLDQQLS